MQYFMVKEVVTVTRYHLVKSTKGQAIQKVKDCGRESEYLESCDDIEWKGKIKYIVDDLPEDWQDDARLKQAARHIESRLSEEPREPLLTSEGKRRRIKKRPSAPTTDKEKSNG